MNILGLGGSLACNIFVSLSELFFALPRSFRLFESMSGRERFERGAQNQPRIQKMA